MMWLPVYEHGGVLAGDCRYVCASMAEASVSAIVTDPPYELGFMGRAWDRSGVAFDPATWAALLRVAKPGAHLVAFGGSRTYHRIACAIEDARWEIRDSLMWLYGTGFPKSLNVSKAIDVAAGEEREVTAPATDLARQWEGWGTALKPAYEPIVLARKPLSGTVAQSVERYGTGGLNVDGCRIEMNGGRWPANVLLDEKAAAMLDEQAGERRSGSRKAGTYSQGRATFGQDGPRDEPEILGSTGGASRFFYCAKASRAEREAGLGHLPLRSSGELTGRADGSDGLKSPRAGAGRSSERRNIHPTVKPVELMRWLVRLVAPPGGVVLDPFAGSGTTGAACALEGHEFVGVELDEEHARIARARIAHARAMAEAQRSTSSMTASGSSQPLASSASMRWP